MKAKVTHFLPLLLALRLTVIAAPNNLQDLPNESLRGLTGVAVEIEALETNGPPVNVVADNASKARVREQVETQLRKAGIKVLDRSTEPLPTLHLKLNSRRSEDGSNHYSIRGWLTQQVILPRPPNRKVVATTWETSGIGHGAGFGLFERAICRTIAAFVAAYNDASEKPRRLERRAIIEVMDPCGP